MPLPLPNLDTRLWADLVDEGRALIPRYAPVWTDHNVHDPGIMLMELFAWLTELEIYRANRIPLRHYRKFLSLVGFAPTPPRPARTTLALTPSGAASITLPQGITFATSNPVLQFRTLAPVTVTAARIQTLQSFDGNTFTDLTRSGQENLPLLPWGANPAADTEQDDRQPAFYLGFEQPLPTDTPVSLWLQFQDHKTGWEERDRLLSEARQIAQDCQPPSRICPDVAPAAAECPPEPQSPEPSFNPALPPHHDITTVWEFFNGTVWQPLDAHTQAIDDTRGLTLDGTVRLLLPGIMAASVQGVVATPAFYVRVRLIRGVPDRAPVVLSVAVNAVPVEQATADRSTLAIAAGVIPLPDQAPIPGQVGRLRFSVDATGSISALAFNAAADTPEVLVIDYLPATPTTPGRLTTTLTLVGQGSGLPHQTLSLPKTAVARGQIQVWTIAGDLTEPWQLRSDLDAAHRNDTHFSLDATQGILSFGDGELGRVVPADALLLAAYDQTAGAGGNLTAVQWQLSGADDAWNQALLNPAIDTIVATTAAALQSITTVAPIAGGADEESLDRAAGRAVETLWAHERLAELCDQTHCTTLDQLDKTAVLSRLAPQRAATLLDFERLALTVPGTHVVRARAWAGIDPAYPCLQAPGTVTVVVVPELPQKRPMPSPGLLNAVQQYLDRRRVIGTRLRVVAPQYLEVRIEARVRSKTAARRDRVRADILQALDRFLDPLQGGANGYGWAFGRDVYRSEILQVIDEVAGVDHVLTLRLIPAMGSAQCGNLCVFNTWLVTPGRHTIEVA